MSVKLKPLFPINFASRISYRQSDLVTNSKHICDIFEMISNVKAIKFQI